MNPNLNQLRRDLGMESPAPSRNQPTTIDVESENVDDSSPKGVSLNNVGTGLLTILGIAIGIWLLADPICMLLLGIWHMICAVVGFIFQLILWIVIACIALSVIGSIFR